MKFENGYVIFESTERRMGCSGESFFCDPAFPDEVYDSDTETIRTLTPDERQEMFEYSVAQWRAWLATPGTKPRKNWLAWTRP
jgi:hypothetical protein